MVSDSQVRLTGWADQCMSLCLVNSAGSQVRFVDGTDRRVSLETLAGAVTAASARSDVRFVDRLG